MNIPRPIARPHWAWLLSATLLSACAPLPSQPPATTDFATQLAEFRYSNYTETPIRYTQNENGSNLEVRLSSEKLHAFAAENRQEIQRYTIARLDTHLQKQLDLSAYTLDSDSKLAKTFSAMMGTPEGHPSSDDPKDFFMIEPDRLVLSQIYRLRPFRDKKDQTPSPQEVGWAPLLFAPKLRTVKRQDGLYQVAWDFYTEVYVIDYRPSDNTFSQPRLFVRTEGDSPLARTEQK